MPHTTFFNKDIEEITWINYLDDEILNMFCKEETVEKKMSQDQEIFIRDPIIARCRNYTVCDDKSELLQRSSLVE